MATGQDGDKTEDPTERRRQDAREKGNIARSVDLNSASMMMMVAIIIYFFALPTSKYLMQMMRNQLSAGAIVQRDSNDYINLLVGLLGELMTNILPLLLMMMGTAVLVNLVQVGFLLSPSAIQPKFSKLSPMQGLKRIFSISSLAKLGISLGKLALLVSIASYALWLAIPKFGNLALFGLESTDVIQSVTYETASLAFQLALALIILGLLDYAFQKWKHEQDLKMTKEEVREEMKQMEGDPHIRQRRREVHRQLATAREINSVSDADVVITNPTHVAVALKYDPEVHPAPVVLAKGMGEIALRIREVAAEHQVPIIERPPLARSLYKTVKTGQPIPPDMYEVFVEIMAYVYRLTGKKMPEV